MLLDRLERLLPFPLQRSVVSSARLDRSFIAEITCQTSTNGTERRVIDAVCDFLLDLFGIESVAAVAVDQGLAPTAFVSEVFMPFIPSSEGSMAAVRAVFAADGRLAERIAMVLPGTTQLINTAVPASDEADRDLAEGWSTQPTVRLLGVITFDRG